MEDTAHPNELEKLHAALLDIAAEIDRVCRKNEIRYTLYYGSLLGAVRHRGFIPWDDDMDVAMLRPEYERFLSACRTDLGPRFQCQTCRTDPDYPYGFGKILLKNSRFVMAGHEGERWQKGVFVDVFPIDYIPESPFRRKLHSFRVFFWRKVLERRAGMNIGPCGQAKRLAFAALELWSRLFTHAQAAERLEREMRRYEKTAGPHASCLCDADGYERNTVPSRFFEDLTEGSFEGLSLLCLRNSDEYLTGMYGDYQSLPPPEQRVTHRFSVLALGPEQGSLSAACGESCGGAENESKENRP